MKQQNLVLVSHRLCPYAQRAAIALQEKSVPFERILIDLDAKPQWFLSLSPLGKLPLLRVPRAHDEVVLFESAAICEYIEDSQSGPALHPPDAIDRARHRAWMEFGSALLGDIWGLETAADAAALERHRLALRAKAVRLEAALGDGPYFGGERFSLVDAVFAPAWRYFDTFDGLMDLRVFEDAPRTSAWRRALAQRPSVMAAVEPDYGDRLLAFMRSQGAWLLLAAKASS